MGRLRVLRFVNGCIFVMLVTACGWPAWSAVRPSRVTFRLGISGANLLCWPTAGLRFVCGPWPYVSGVPLEGQMFSVLHWGTPLPKLPSEGGISCRGWCWGAWPHPVCLGGPSGRVGLTWITVRFALTDTACTLHLASSSLRCANKRLSAKQRLPLHGQPIPESRGPPILFPVCLRASSLPRKSRVALLNFHEGPFSCTHGPVVNFNQR